MEDQFRQFWPVGKIELEKLMQNSKVDGKIECGRPV